MSWRGGKDTPHRVRAVPVRVEEELTVGQGARALGGPVHGQGGSSHSCGGERGHRGLGPGDGKGVQGGPFVAGAGASGRCGGAPGQDVVLDAGQFGAGPVRFLAQVAAGAVAGPQGVPGPAAAVGGHEQGAQVLLRAGSMRVLGELGRHGGVAPAGALGRVELLRDEMVALVQAVGGVEHLERIGILEGQAFPQLQGLADEFGGPVGVVGAHRGALLQQSFEAFGIEFAGMDGELVAARSEGEAFGVGAQQAQSVHVRVQPCGGGGGVVAPQHGCGHDGVGAAEPDTRKRVLRVCAHGPAWPWWGAFKGPKICNCVWPTSPVPTAWQR